jgi:hypothetical protein
METKDLEKFDPSVAELTKMVNATKGITATDLKDKDQMAIVRENRIALKNARVKIGKIGKELRDDANKFASAVIAKEKSLIAIIEPEEDRLEAIEEEAKALIIREERLEKLPSRKERLTAIDNRTQWATDDELLEMDSTQFEAFYNQCVAEHNENLRVQALEEQAEKERIAKQEQDERDAKIKADQDKKQAELDAKEKKIADERAKIEKEKIDIAHKKEIEAEKEKARLQAIEDEKVRAENEKKENARKEKEAKELLEKRKKYQEFLKSHGWTEKTKADFKVEETEDGWVLFKRLGVFKK